MLSQVHRTVVSSYCSMQFLPFFITWDTEHMWHISTHNVNRANAPSPVQNRRLPRSNTTQESRNTSERMNLTALNITHLQISIRRLNFSRGYGDHKYTIILSSCTYTCIFTFRSCKLLTVVVKWRILPEHVENSSFWCRRGSIHYPNTPQTRQFIKLSLVSPIIFTDPANKVFVAEFHC